MHTISISGSVASQARKTEQSPLAETNNPIARYETVQNPYSTHRDVFRTITKERNVIWYHGLFGRVDVRVKSSSLNTSKSNRPWNRSTSEEKIIKIIPAFFQRTFELRLLSSFGQIARTLRTYPILHEEAPIFVMSYTGDVEGLQVLLSSGTVSPFVLDQDGWSLLHVRVQRRHSNRKLSH